MEQGFRHTTRISTRICRCAAFCNRILAGNARIAIEVFRFLVVVDHEHVPVRLRQDFAQFGAWVMMVQCIMFNLGSVSRGHAEEERNDEAANWIRDRFVTLVTMGSLIIDPVGTM